MGMIPPFHASGSAWRDTKFLSLRAIAIFRFKIFNYRTHHGREEFESLIQDFGGDTPASLGERTFDGGEGVRVATIEDSPADSILEAGRLSADGKSEDLMCWRIHKASQRCRR